MDEAQLSGGIDMRPDQTVALGRDHCGTAALLHIFANEGSVVAFVGDQFARWRNSADALRQAGDIGYVSGRYNERSGPALLGVQSAKLVLASVLGTADTIDQSLALLRLRRCGWPGSRRRRQTIERALHPRSF